MTQTFRISAFAFMFLMVEALFAQAPIQTSSVLKNATIYNQGASLHHTSKQVALPKGNSELVINQIAQNVDPQSVRVVSDNNQITILSVSFEKDYLVSDENESSQYREVKKKLDEAQKLLNEMTNARKAEESALSLLEANKNFGGQSGITPGSMTSMINFYREEYKKLSANIIALKDKESKQQREVDKLQKQLREVGGSGRNAGQLVVRLNAAQRVTANFDIEYFTFNVSWTPFYEIRMDQINRPLQLDYKANVSQTTGIDWKQVNLAFSSGTPRRNNNAPQLNTWWIGFRSKNDDIQYMLQRKAAGVQVQVESMETRRTESDAVVVEENQLATSFVVSTPYDIYSNQKPQAVQLKTYELPATYAYFTAPRLDESAFLIAKVSDWQKYNLLPGEANLIIDNNFAGRSYINPNSTEETLTLSLGRDDRITTKRERIDEEGSTSFLGRYQKRVYTYEISVRNSRKEAVTIDVKEQFPRSTEKDIEIKLLETSGANLDQDKGELSWTLNLKSGETKKVKVSYSVRLPADREVEGI